MKKILFLAITILCMCLMACNEREAGPDDAYAVEFDSSAGVEEILNSGGENADSESEESEDFQDLVDEKSEEENHIGIEDAFEESSLEWKGDKAALSADYLYRMDGDDAFVIDFKWAGNEWGENELIPNPPQDQTITIRTGNNELQLVGNYIIVNEAYLLQTGGGYFLLLETDEDGDMDEKLWLFKFEDGKVIQCGDAINAKLDNTLVWDANKIQCLEITELSGQMTEKELTSGVEGTIYQRQDYKIQDDKLTAINLLEETEEIKTDLHTYKVSLFRNEETQYVVRWEVEIYNGNTLLQTIYYNHDEYVSCLPSGDALIWEEDVNFDGVKDVLVWQGHYGTHGDLGYRCYLANAETGLYEWCESFQEIPNPKVDREKKLICGTSRGGANVYHDVFYRYDGSAFVLARKDMYVWDDTSEQYYQAYSLDASVAVYTNTDYALVGSYEGTSGLQYSFNVYTSMDGVGECTDIGNIAVIPEDESADWDDRYLYKISEGQYYVDSVTDSNSYYLFAELRNDVWTIEIKDRNGNVLDTLTQTSHYEY